jgi:hypothetical protein
MHGVVSGLAVGIRLRGNSNRIMGGERAVSSLFGFVATGGEYGNGHCDVPDGVPDPEHAEPRCARHHTELDVLEDQFVRLRQKHQHDHEGRGFDEPEDAHPDHERSGIAAD